MIHLLTLAKASHAHIFHGGPRPMGAEDKVFVGGLKAVKAHGYTMIQQNPHKVGSDYAKLARQGHQVMWVTKDHPGAPRGHYVGAVVDGVPEPRLEHSKYVK